MSQHTVGGERNCAVTGSSGYFGSRLCQYLEHNGWRVFRLTSHPTGEVRDEIPFTLLHGTEPGTFARHQIQSLIHCAYDFRLRSWSDIVAQNVQGSCRLLQTARDESVRRIVFLSTMSAFPGCKSMYGRAKLEIEKEAIRLGASVVRPGLIYGEHSGSLMGALDKLVQTLPLLPVIESRKQLLYAAHEDDLAALVSHLLTANEQPTRPIIAAAEQGMTLGEILRTLADRHGKHIRLVRIPWQLVWAGLRAAEFLRVPINFRSDSVISLLNQDPAPDFSTTARAGVTFRKLEATVDRSRTASPVDGSAAMRWEKSS